MRMSTSKSDRISELRVRMGFPADAGFWMRLLLIVALPPMLLLRRKVGSRVVSLFRVLAMSALMLLWGGLACVLLATGDWDRLLELFAAVCAVEFGIALMGTAHRMIRWVMYQKGEKLSTLSPGISHFSYFIPNANAERYLDPFLMVAAGVFLCLPSVPLALHAPGSWLAISGLALFAVESYMHGIQLDQQDGLLKAEAHEQVTERFYKQAGEPASPSSAGATVATGLGPDLQASIARREQRRAETTALSADARQADAAVPAPRDAASPGESGVTTFRAATQHLFEEEKPSRDGPPGELAREQVASPTPIAKEKPDRERAKRVALGAAIGLAVWLVTMGAPSVKAGLSALVAPRAVSTGRSEEASLDAAELYRRAENLLNGKGGISPDDANAIRLYRMAAEQGEARSQFKLGYLYQVGKAGLQQSDEDAVAWYKKALAQHIRSAASNLGGMYLEGRGGLPRDETEAVRLFRMAADAGSPEGQFNLARMYETGKGGLDRSGPEAASWYRKAADQANAAAENALGEMYSVGRLGVVRDDVAAVSWFRKSAEHGSRDGQAQLASMYLTGRGGPARNAAEAVKWLQLAAGQGEPWAQFRLGLMHQLGEGGLVQDDVKAVQWFRKAALQDQDEAQVWMAMSYETGSGGLPKSRAEAMAWYGKAADNGNEQAKKILKR